MALPEHVKFLIPHYCELVKNGCIKKFGMNRPRLITLVTNTYAVTTSAKNISINDVYDSDLMSDDESTDPTTDTDVEVVRAPQPSVGSDKYPSFKDPSTTVSDTQSCDDSGKKHRLSCPTS